MFGYIQPYKPLMLVKDYEYYKGIYCSLCKQLGKEYGVLARFTLSYDCTFYAIMALSIEGACPTFTQGRCPFNPTKRCNFCKTDENAISAAAAVSVLSVYYKLEDDIKDSAWPKKLLSKLLKGLVSGAKKKAEKKYPQIAQSVQKLSVSQEQAEKDNKAGADKLAEPTAVMLRELMGQLAKDDTQKKVCGEFGYFLGKWVYLMDAADDYDKDKKKRNANPFVYYFAQKNVLNEERIQYINGILNETVSRIIPAYYLIDMKTSNPVLDNMAEHGFGYMQKKILFDKVYNHKGKEEQQHD